MSDSDRAERDKQWAIRIQSGDREAFKALFQTYAEPLCTFAEQYTESSEIAEELVQDLFLKIWEDRRDWSPSGSVKSYLYTATRNLALDYLKHERVVDEWREGRSQDGRSTLKAPDENFRHKKLHRAVRSAVEELPERSKQVFELSRQHGLTYREIASVLDISVKTVETHMRRAFKSLREQLAPHKPPESTKGDD